MGAINNHEEKTVSVPMHFLGEGKYGAEIYSDSDDTGNNPNNFILQRRALGKEDALSLKLASGGGFVIHLKKQ